VKINAASLDFRVQARPNPRELLPLLETMGMLEDPLKIPPLPQGKVSIFASIV